MLKKKGFKEPCLALYTTTDQELVQTPMEGRTVLNRLQIAAPIYQQIVDWFREKHKIGINITEQDDNWLQQFKNSKKFICHFTGKSFNVSDNDYYVCLNKAIEEAFKLI